MGHAPEQEVKIPSFSSSMAAGSPCPTRKPAQLINKKYGAYRTVGSLSSVVNVGRYTTSALHPYRYSAFAVPTVTNQVRQGACGAVRIGAKVEF